MALKLLKRYRVQDLEPGMVLGKTILNEKGQVMLDQGKVIFRKGRPLPGNGGASAQLECLCGGYPDSTTEDFCRHSGRCRSIRRSIGFGHVGMDDGV